MTTLFPALPGFAGQQTHAAWPVWSGSTTQTVRFQPMPKKAAVRLWHRARDFDRGTHQPGRLRVVVQALDADPRDRRPRRWHGLAGPSPRANS